MVIKFDFYPRREYFADRKTLSLSRWGKYS